MAISKWTLDPIHSEIEFKIRHLMITNVTGEFKTYEASVETEDEDFLHSKISFTADVASISTGNEQRDGHLKAPDFFDVEKYPKLSFVATKYEKVDDDSYELYGNLTIRDITKAVKLDVEFGGVVKDPWGNTRAGFTINGKVNRKDFGLVWNAATETGGVMLGDDVRLSASVQLIKQA